MAKKNVISFFVAKLIDLNPDMYSLLSTFSSTLSNINISLEFFLLFTFLQLLQYLSLGQQVDFPTDSMGNILDLVITGSVPVNTPSMHHTSFIIIHQGQGRSLFQKPKNKH